ncbi:GerMN domain-containing protein [Extibacter sp. GGCC_0201]|uniref:GerMN domain-containing protein n=1 Tax=Extibacter sp. GGCC_0201 TaxID=2731209 RepID=UPI001FB64627|nr:GerMN domain-containing protein [Extibacter sp. GGCC_0201]
MRKKCMKCLCILLIAMLLPGCGRGRKPEISGTCIYYVSAEGTRLVKEAYDIKGDGAEAEVEAVLDDMQKEPEDEDCRSAFPEGIRAEDWKLDKGRLDLYFNESYKDIDTSSEILLRAAVVQSLVQIAGVDYVNFYIGGAPLTDNEGDEVGYMHAEDFVQNTGSSLHSYQLANLHLYYADKKGDKLGEEEVSVRYNSNMSIEKLVVEQLIKGPSMQEHQAALPPETKLLGISVKDGICYVNFDDQFQSAVYGINPELAIYSLVNSIVEAGNASQVQISVNGETDVKYQGVIDLGKPLSRNLDLEEGEGK